MQSNLEEIVNCCICNATSALYPDFVHVNDGTIDKDKPIILVISSLLRNLGHCESTIILRSQHICSLCIQDLNEYDEVVSRLQSIQERFKHLLSTENAENLQSTDSLVSESISETVPEKEMQLSPNSVEQNKDGLNDYLIEISDIPDNIIEEADELFGDNEEIDVTGLNIEFDSQSEWLRLSPLSEEIVTVESNLGDSANFKIRCPKCNKVFFNKIRYKDHVEFEHRSDPDVLVCRVCHRLFRSLEYLELHMNVHEGKTEKQCRYCDKTYTKKENVLRHMQIHWHKNLQCEICGESFSNNTSYSNHKALHEIEGGPIECTICTQIFKNKRTLKTHMLTHDKDRTRYKCNFCLKSFSEKYRLKIHCQTQHSVIDHFEVYQNV